LDVIFVTLLRLHYTDTIVIVSLCYDTTVMMTCWKTMQDWWTFFREGRLVA